jgi:putative FmdB family regulatory protein
MPIYNYVCGRCHQPFSDLIFGNQKPTCPKCGSMSAERQLSTFAVHGQSAPAPAVGGCGTCGDPRGPGSCSTPG